MVSSLLLKTGIFINVSMVSTGRYDTQSTNYVTAFVGHRTYALSQVTF